MRLEEIYQEIQPRIYAFFYVKTLGKEVAEDLTHEVFYEAIKGADSFSGHSTVQTWLFGIAKHKLSKYYRSNRYKANLTIRLANERTGTISPEDQFIQSEEQQYLLARINRLDERSKETVILRMYGELAFKEIGELMGTSENVARIQFHRAKLRLHKEMEGYYDS